MKSASAGLIALLNSDTFIMADLITLTLIDASVYRYTSADIDLIVSGNTFSKALKFKRGRTRLVVGVEVDTLDLDIYPESSNLIGGVPFLQALARGVLDGAQILLERVFMPTWGDTSAGTLILFSGRVSDIEFSRTEARLSIKSDLELLNVKLPRTVYQPGCTHTLYDAGCALNRASFAVNSSVASGSTDRIINCSLAQAAGYFDQGYLAFTSGALNGVKRNVRVYAPGVITLSYPLSAVPAISDTFTIYPGCDKLQSTCVAKFNNIVHFRAWPYIPVPETSI
jgi:uncharacterized phage protein (TIGR02218 family)